MDDDRLSENVVFEFVGRFSRPTQIARFSREIRSKTGDGYCVEVIQRAALQNLEPVG